MDVWQNQNLNADRSVLLLFLLPPTAPPQLGSKADLNLVEVFRGDSCTGWRLD